MPTGHRKLEKLSELIGKLRKSYRKAIGRSSTGLQPRQSLAVQQYDATNDLPSIKDNERRRQRQFFSFLRLRLFIGKQHALERYRSEAALGAEKLFHTAKTFATQTKADREKSTLKFFFSIDGRLFRSFEDFSDCF